MHHNLTKAQSCAEPDDRAPGPPLTETCKLYQLVSPA
jgi:hypothetical protein